VVGEGERQESGARNDGFRAVAAIAATGRSWAESCLPAVRPRLAERK
jgi:hypothetical protein